MKLVSEIAAIRQFCQTAPRPIALALTMGALHEAHAALIQSARRAVGKEGTVVVSIFVNPTQFNKIEDLSSYPRPFAADKELCQREQVDFLFHPSEEEMYQNDASITIEEKKLSLGLCGRSRPGHFSGALTVITKFLNIITPDIVIFGEKDWQQLALVRRLIRDLHYPIRVIAHPTVRAYDHLALSSRNINLDSKERALAPQIYTSLQATAKLVEQGEIDVSKLITITTSALQTIPKTTTDYVAIVDSHTLEPLEKLIPGTIEARLLVAVEFEKARLIDNIALTQKA